VGGGVFTAGNGWWWVPIVGPMIGGVLGGGAYRGDRIEAWKMKNEE
jgi:glycerol uptake facilitator-like aquaporin